jgi:hypothetical protein
VAGVESFDTDHAFLGLGELFGPKSSLVAEH